MRYPRFGLVALILGLVIGVTYWLARAFHWGKIGDSTDIGGGVVQLLACTIVALGAFFVVQARRNR